MGVVGLREHHLGVFLAVVPEDEGEEHGCYFISMIAAADVHHAHTQTHTHNTIHVAHTHTLRRALPHCCCHRFSTLPVTSLSRNVLPPPKKVVHHFVFIRNVEDAAVEVRLV